MGSNALIGSLSILTQIDTSRLSKGRKETEQQVRGMVAQVQSFGSSLLTARNLATGAFATGVVSAFNQVTDRLSKLDDVGDLAERLSISAQSLMELQHAATIADVSTDDLQSGLQRLLKTAGEAGAGSSSAVAAFRAIGLELKDIQGLSATDLFGTVAEKLRRIGDEQRQMALGSDLFGKGFATLIPLVNEGEAGIRRLTEERRRLLNLTEEEIAAVGRWDASTKRLSASWQVFWDRWAVKSAGTLALVNDIAAATLTGDISIGSIATGENLVKIQEAIAQGNKQIADDLANQKSIYEDLIDLGGTFARTFDGVGPALQKISETLREDVAKSLREMQFDADTFGMDARDKQIEQLRRRGANPDQLAALKEADARLDALKAQDDFKRKMADEEKQRAAEAKRKQEAADKEHADRIARLKEDALTDEDRLAARRRELIEARDKNEITPAEFTKLMNDLEGPKNPFPFTGAALAGSNAAREIMLRTSLGGNSGPWAGLQKNAEAALGVQQQMLASLQEIAKNQPEVANF